MPSSIPPRRGHSLSRRLRRRPFVELLEDRLTPASLHWLGTNGSGWSDPGNWFEDQTPVNGDVVILDTAFAAAQGKTIDSFTSTNDLPGATLSALGGLVVNDTDAAAGHDFTITGNALTLSGGLTNSMTGTATTVSLDALTLAGDTTVTSDAGTLTLGGTIDLAGYTLTVTGAGDTAISGVLSGTAFRTITGLKGDYFDLSSQPGAVTTSLLDPASPNWLGLKAPTATATTPQVNFPNNAVAINSFSPYASVSTFNVAARWTGTIAVPDNGLPGNPVTFFTQSDDGSRLFIDGQLVVDNDLFQGSTLRQATVNLTPGPHAIDIEYFQGGGAADMTASWDPTGGSSPVLIPASVLSYQVGGTGLVKTGTGTLTLSGDNTYAGATAIDQGTLVAAHDNALGSTAAGTTLAAGATLGFAGGVTYSAAEPLTLSGTLENLGGSNSFAGPITLAGDATVASDAGTLMLSGAVDLGSHALTVTGAGDTVLSGAVSSATGLRGDYFNLSSQGVATTLLDPTSPNWLGLKTPTVTATTPQVNFPNNAVAINSFSPYANVGTFNVAARWTGTVTVPDNGLPGNPVTFFTQSDDGSRLLIDGQLVVDNDNFQGPTQRQATVNLTPGPHQIDIEYFQGGGGADMTASWDPTGGSNAVLIPASVLSPTATSLTKTGTGTLTLAATGTLAGSATINGGTVLVDGSTGAGVTVNAGGTLGGTGTVGGPVTVNAGGTLDPGDGPGAPGLLSTGSVTFAAGSTFHADLDGAATPGSDYDQVAVTGTLTSNGATLETVTGAGYTPARGQALSLINNDAADAVGGTFAGLAEGAGLPAGAPRFHITYAGGDGNDVVLNADNPPVAGQASLPGGLTVNENSTAADPANTLPESALLAASTDPDGDPLTPVVQTGPAHGTAVVNPDGSITYTPDAEFHGSDSFTYAASDGFLTSAPIAVAVTVNFVNEAPSFTLPGNVTAPDNGGAVTQTGFAGDVSPASVNPAPPDEAGQGLTFTVVGVSDPGLFTAAGQPALSPDGQTLTFTPAVQDPTGVFFSGTATVTVQAQDDGGTLNGGQDTTLHQFTITIVHGDRAPTLSLPGAQRVPPGAPLVFSGADGSAVSVADIDNGGGVEQVTLQVGHGTLTLGGTAGLTSVSGNGSASVTLRGTVPDLEAALDGLTYVSEAAFTGADSLAVLIDDLGNSGAGGPLSAGGAVTLNVLPPTLTGSADQGATESTPASFDLGSFTDAAGAGPWQVSVDWGDRSAPDTFTAATAGALGGRTHTYAEEGTYTITVRVTDAAQAVGQATFTARVDAPLPPGSPHGPHGTPGERFIAEAFHELTGRGIDVATLVHWSKRLHRGPSRVAVVRGLMHDGHWRTLWHSNLVQDLYRFILGRPASAEEVSAALGSVGRRSGFRRLTRSLLVQARGRRVTLKDAEAVLLQFFYREFLDRTVDGKGLHAYLRRFNGQGDGQVLAAILGSAESWNRSRG